MSLLMAGLIVFLGIHLVPVFPPWRQRLSSRLGEGGYKGLFSALSVIGLALIIVGFVRAPATERVFAPVPVAIAAAPWAMALAFILLAAANTRGYVRQMLKHPMLLGILVWSTVHLLANGDLRGFLLFGGFLLYSVIDLISVRQRGAVKVFVPAAKYDVFAIAAGIAAALGVMTFHRLLFGVRVVGFGI
jgi:uncharacterized membrane protein